MHIFAITSPPSGVHIFAWPANFRNFAPKPCIFSHTTPVRPARAAGAPGAHFTARGVTCVASGTPERVCVGNGYILRTARHSSPLTSSQ